MNNNTLLLCQNIDYSLAGNFNYPVKKETFLPCKSLRTLIVVLFFLLLGNNLQATIRYVKNGGTTAANAAAATSWAAACADLQAVINASTSGDEVWVAAGNYQPASGQSFAMKEGVKIYGGFATTGNPAFADRNWHTNITTLQGNGSRVITNDNNGLTAAAVLDGFVITGGNVNNNNGGGMYNNNSSPLIANCIFRNNTTNNSFGGGGGICNTNSSSPTIINCVFTGNTAYDTQQTSSGGGVLNEGSSPSIINCLFYGNSASFGGGIDNINSSNAKIINCTIADNTGWGVLNRTSNPTIINSIIFNNGLLNSNSTPVISYSLIQGQAGGTNGNLDGTAYTAAQVFENPAGNNYALKQGSPVIDMGIADTTGLHLPATDLKGDARIQNNRVDIGAYEIFPCPNISRLYVNIANSNSVDGSSWATALTELADALVIAKNCPAVTEIWVAKGTYKPLYTPEDGQNFSATPANPRDKAFLMVSGVKLYGGFDPAAGITDLTHNRIVASSAGEPAGGGTILSGDLDGNDSYDANGNITGGTNANNAYNVIVTVNADTYLDGFSIKGGNAIGDSIIVNGKKISRKTGGGINVSSSLMSTNIKVEVLGCSISGNSADVNGGGINSSINAAGSKSIVTVVGSNIRGNTAIGGSGGAIYSLANWESLITVTNSSIKNNQANAGSGGGIHSIALQNTSVTVTDCSITDNVAGINGGGIYSYSYIANSNVSVTGSSISSNTANSNSGSAIYSFTSSFPNTVSLKSATISGNTGSAVIYIMNVNNTFSNKIFNSQNSIVFGNITNANAPSLIETNGSESIVKNIEHSLVQGENSILNGNLDGTSPSYTVANIFTNAANSDYTLKPGSAAINAGSDALYTAGVGGDINTAIDLAGNLRKQGTAIDMGAFEATPCAPGARLYVNKTNASPGNGGSWATAFTELTDALTIALNCPIVTEIWVAAGTYLPISGQSFAMIEGVKIYGGFAATGNPAFADRNWHTNITTLQGNGSRVVTNDNNGLTGSAVLDGFVITGGNTTSGGGGIYNSFSSPTLINLTISGNTANNFGGGIYNNFSSPAITNVTISSNTAIYSGGGMSNFSSSPTLNHVTISGNTTAANGGGIYNYSSTYTSTNVVISGNTAADNGGGISNFFSSPTLINVTISGNNASDNGGGIFNLSDSDPGIINTIIIGNNSGIANSDGNSIPVIKNSLVQSLTGGSDGNLNGNVITAEQVFVSPAAPASAPTTAGNYNLNACSPAVNKGSNSLFNGLNDDTKDLAGSPRVYGGTTTGIIDLGAYEYQGVALSATALPATQTVCSGAIATIELSSNIGGVSFNWTRDNTTNVTGITATGNGNISGSLVNTTTTTQTVIFTITPVTSDCQGLPFTATVTVNPRPVALVIPVTQSVCTGAITPIVPTSNLTGTTFNWTRNNTTNVTGIGAAGNGNITGTLVNNTITAQTVTFTITPATSDCAGEAITATVIVGATPVITCPNNITVNTANGMCSAVVNYNPTITGIPTPAVTYSLTRATTGNGTGTGSGATFNKGVTTVTITATNDCGTANCSFTVTVRDVQPPAITCPPAVTVQCAADVPAVNIAAVTATDNCAVVTVTHVSDIISNRVCENKYTLTRTYRATDEAGNTTNCQQIITVNDDIAPALITAGTWPANETGINTCNIPTGATEAEIKALFTDNCSGNNITVIKTRSIPVYQGCNWSVTYNYTIKDACGSTYTNSIHYSGSDQTAPNISGIPLAATYSCAELVPAAIPQMVTVTDNCDISPLVTVADVTTPGSSGKPNDFTITRTWTATDLCGNSATASQLITVKDDTAPQIISCANARAAVADASCEAEVPVFTSDIRVSHNCQTTTPASVTQSPVAGTKLGVGVHTITLTVTDADGNTSQCTTTFTVTDKTPPQITACATARVIELNTGCTATVPDLTTQLTVIDNCTPQQQLQITQSPAAGTALTVGTHPVTTTVTDASGNSSYCNTTITVTDIQKPVISCGTNITSPVNAAGCKAMVNIPAPAVTDNCVVNIITWVITGATSGQSAATGLNYISSNQLFNMGITTVTYTVFDNSGNSGSCSFTVTVVPVNITATTSTVTACGTTTGSITVTATGGTAPYQYSLDNNIYQNSSSFTGLGSGNYTITIKDANGCTGTATATITEGNSITATAVTTPVSCSNTGTLGTITVIVTGGATPYSYSINGGNSYQNSNSFSGLNGGNYTITVKDVNGCTATVSTTIQAGNNITVTALEVAATPATCNGTGGNITTRAIFSGGAGALSLSYQWYKNGSTEVYAITPNLLNVATGTYKLVVTVTDAGSPCVSEYSVTTTVNTTSNITGTISGTTTVLQGSSPAPQVIFNATGGTAPYIYSYSINNGGIQTTSNTAITQSTATAGEYIYRLLSVTDATGCTTPVNQQAVITINITTAPVISPDLSVQLMVLPAIARGVTELTGIVRIFEINGRATTAPIKVYISKDDKISLRFMSSAIELNGVDINNSIWQLDATGNGGYYIFSTDAVIPGEGTAALGFTMLFSPGASNGKTSITATILGGSGGETRVNNNADAEGVDYFMN